MSKKLPSLSVFFPCFNEQDNLPLFLAEALRILPQVAKRYEIIIVNDGSTDKTALIADQWAKTYPQVRVIHHPHNRGYGMSLRSGFTAAQYEWVFFTDGDCQFSLKELPLFINYTDRYSVVIGFRKNRAEGFSRARNARLYKMFVDALFRLHVTDIDCAFKLFKKSELDSITLESTGAFISAELLYKLKKKQVKFKQVGVTHFPRKFGKPTGANWKVIAKACFESFKLYLHIKFHLFDSKEF